MNKPIVVTAEIPAGSKFKYEQDQDDLCLIIDRSLKVRIPENYGYIHNTLADDGDALDVFIITGGESIEPLSKVAVKIIGAIECEDNCVSDPKILAVLEDSDLDDEIVENSIHQIYNYLGSYKEGVEVGETLDAIKATKLYLSCLEAE